MAVDMAEEEYLMVHEARGVLGISRTRMTELLKDRVRLPVYRRGIDRRVKWLRRADVERVARELRAATEEVPSPDGGAA